MNIKIKLSIILILIFSSLQIFGQDDHFNPSWKEIISSEESSKKFSEYYDDQSNLYSNYKYGFSVKFPESWEIDRGRSEHTVIRGINKDIGCSFIVNVIEMNVKKENHDVSAWDFDNDKWRSFFIKKFESSLNSKIINPEFNKTYINNHEAMRVTLHYYQKHRDKRYKIKCSIYQTIKPPLIFNVGYHIPALIYQNNPKRYNTLIDRFHFIPKNK